MSTTKITTGQVRFTFCNVFKPRPADDNGKEKYGVCILISKKDKKTVAAINAAIEAAKEAGKSSHFGGKIPKTLKTPLRDGDDERDEYPEFVGHYFLNANSGRKPNIVDRNMQAIIDADEFYSGCYGLASINFYPFSGKSIGVAAGLENLLKLKDGEPLAGGAESPTEAFKDVDLSEYDEDDDIL